MPVPDAKTKLCAVIGHPVGHSLSPAIHNAAFRFCDLNYVYVAFDAVDAGAVLTGMRAIPSFRGLSVTIPHKLAVIPLLDEIDPLAKRIGSVNTITNEAGRLIGASTDGPGALRAFAEADVPLIGKRVLFLGTGGAVRAVAFALAESSGIAGITILGRTRLNVLALLDDLRAVTSIELSEGDLQGDLKNSLRTHDIIIHGTPIGMTPGNPEASPVPAGLLRPEQTVFDMVYNPLQTRLVRDALRAGCGVILGREMLLHQAALQFERWTGQRAPVEAMRLAFDRASGGAHS